MPRELLLLERDKEGGGGESEILRQRERERGTERDKGRRVEG